MADEDFATLRFRIDTAQMAQANQYLTQLTQNTQQSADAQNKHASSFDQLNRSMQAMLQQQREMNALLVQSVQAQRQGTQAIDDHISTLTKLSAGINAATLAYDVFGRKQQEVTSQGTAQVNAMTQSYQQMATTLDQLAAKI